MAAARLAMREIREILRQKWELRRSHREVARSLSVSVGTVSGVARRAGAVGLDWAAVAALSEEELEARVVAPRPRAARSEPDWAALHRERTRPGVTLSLLHLEYLEREPDGFRYSQFCDRYRRWAKTLRLSMRQVHVAGAKMFVDYAGSKPSVVDPQTGGISEVELFVAVLGASNYTFAEATRTQRSADFLASHVHAVEFFGGAAIATVPDQLKTGVTRACRYEPETQRAYEEWAHHYGTTILPARPAHPRDKAYASHYTPSVL